MEVNGKKVKVTEEQKEEVQRRIHRSAIFQKMFSGEEGLSVLKEIDIISCYKSNTFDPDPYKHAYNAGQLSISVFIHNCIDMNLDQAKKLLQENKNER